MRVLRKSTTGKQNRCREKIIALAVVICLLITITTSVYAANTPDICESYADIDMSGWAHAGIHWAIENNLMKGIGTNSDGFSIFSPNSFMTRAQLVTIMYRYVLAYEQGVAEADIPPRNWGNPYKDVSSKTTWSYQPILWANENGYATGISDTSFAPNAPVTREQLITILYRYVKSQGYEYVEPAYDYKTTYEDGNSVSRYADEAMAWATTNGIISGVSKNKIDPKGTATRAQVATILLRFSEKMPLDHEHIFEPKIIGDQETLAKYTRTKQSCEKDESYWFCCSECSARSTTEYIITKYRTGHEWVEVVDAKYYQGTKCGEHPRYYVSCAKCGAARGEGYTFENTAEPELAHKWVVPDDETIYSIPATIIKQSTCTEPGEARMICERCSKVSNIACEIPPRGHAYLEEPYISATCTEPAYSRLWCYICNYRTNDKIPKGEPLGHSFTKQAPVTSESIYAYPTCTVGLVTYNACSRCGKIGRSPNETCTYQWLHAPYIPVKVNSSSGESTGPLCVGCGDAERGCGWDYTSSYEWSARATLRNGKVITADKSYYTGSKAYIGRAFVLTDSGGLSYTSDATYAGTYTYSRYRTDIRIVFRGTTHIQYESTQKKYVSFTQSCSGEIYYTVSGTTLKRTFTITNGKWQGTAWTILP